MNSEKLEQVWSEVCGQVKSYNNIDPSQINAFFSRLHPQAMSDGFLMITADNDFIKTWIERHYVEFIKRALNDLYHMPFTVIIEASRSGACSSRRAGSPGGNHGDGGRNACARQLSAARGGSCRECRKFAANRRRPSRSA